MTNLITSRPPDSLADFARELTRRLASSEAAGFMPWSEAEFGDWAWRLHRLQSVTNPPYRAWLNAQSLPAGPADDWRCIPVVPTQAFQALELTSLTPAERTGWFQSSGTTGQVRSRHFQGTHSLEMYRASARPWFRVHLLPGLSEGEGARRCRFFGLMPPVEACPHSSLVHMLADATEHFGAPGSEFVGKVGPAGDWELDGQWARERLEVVSGSGHPVLVVGTAFQFVQFTDAAREGGWQLTLPAGSRVMETGGYKGRSRELSKAELHAAIRDQLRLPEASIVTEYGMSELSSQAYDRVVAGPEAMPGMARRLRFPPWCRATVVDPETGREVPGGRVGLLRVMDLANVWSVAGIQTSDLARREGDGLELLGRSSGAEPRGCSLMTR
jgi:hypothetical protein